MTKLMCQGEDPVQVAFVVQQDTGFSDSGHTHAESASAFAFTGVSDLARGEVDGELVVTLPQQIVKGDLGKRQKDIGGVRQGLRPAMRSPSNSCGLVTLTS